MSNVKQKEDEILQEKLCSLNLSEQYQKNLWLSFTFKLQLHLAGSTGELGFGQLQNGTQTI